jgi:Tfp pilus assembly protein PilO
MSQLRKWSALTSVAVVAVLAAGWFLLISPQRGEASSLRSEKATQDQANAQLRTKIEVLKSQARDLPAQRARIAGFGLNIPADPQLPSLIRELSAAARVSGVDLDSLAPAEPAALPTGEGSTVGSKPSTVGVTMIPLVVSVEGDYFGVEQFLNKVESFRRVMLVSGLKLDVEEQNGPSNRVKAVITARVFMTAPAPGTARPAGAAAGAPAGAAAGAPAGAVPNQASSPASTATTTVPSSPAPQ